MQQAHLVPHRLAVLAPADDYWPLRIFLEALPNAFVPHDLENGGEALLYA